MNDNTEQDLSSFIFESIDFLELIHNTDKTNRCLVHCHAGISRSVSLVLSYLMYKNKYSFEEALEIVKSKRSVACPNISFECQLKMFHTLLQTHKPNHVVYSKLRPHINSSIRPFCIAQTLYTNPDDMMDEEMTTKMLSTGDSPMYELDSLFDSRGCFVVYTLLGSLYIWIGTLSSPDELKSCEKYCDQLERIVGASHHILVRENEETLQFLEEAHLKAPSHAVHLHKRYNAEYVSLTTQPSTIIRYPDWKMVNKDEMATEMEIPLLIVRRNLITGNVSELEHSTLNTTPKQVGGHNIESSNITKAYNQSSDTLNPSLFKTAQHKEPMKRQIIDNPKRRSNTILSGRMCSPYGVVHEYYSIDVFIPMHFPRFSVMKGIRRKENIELLSERSDYVQSSVNTDIVDQFVQHFRLDMNNITVSNYYCSVPFGVFYSQTMQ